MTRCVALVAALTILGGTATALAAPPRPVAPHGGALLYQKTTKYIFEDEEVPGDLARPDTLFVGGRVGSRFGTLIKLRADFMPEMIKACEDL